MTSRRTLFLAAAVGAALVAAAQACGGNGGGGGGPAGSPGPDLVLGPQETCIVDLAATPPHTVVYGADAGDFLADRFSLATGDFNGDGLGDILVGAPLGDGDGNNAENAGEAYIIYGSETPPAVIDLDQPDAAGATFYGGARGDNFGFTVAAADVNGDGSDDVLIGARFAGTPDRPAAGSVLVFYGGPDLSGIHYVADADVTISGAEANDFLGIALATGDLDGDGVADILMGAAGSDGEDAGRADAGAVAVIRGGDLPAAIDLAFEKPGLTVFGASAGDTIPNHLAAGDLDSDGRDELIIGAPFADSADFEDAGRVYVVSSRAGGEVIDLAGGADSGLTGGARKDGLGFEVATGDVNGDGVQDLLAGARDADGPQDQVNNGGEIHVMLGGDRLPRAVDLSRESSDALITSADEGDSLGFTVAAADVNGDGFDDVIAGAPLADGCENARLDAGDVYIINGRDPMPRTTTLKSAGDLTFLGPQEGDAAGFSASTTDFNGDGLMDVLIGALQADGPDDSRPDSGEVWVVLASQEAGE